MKVVELPYHYSPRSYQTDLWNAFFIDNKKRLLCVWHRRAGKDKTCINIMQAAAMQRVGNYYYLFPELKQARRDIWEGIDADGMRFIDHFHPSLIKKTNKTEMTIEFINGSIFRLCGSDRYDSLMGSNPVGIIFSEYSLQNPLAWDYLRPILSENGGWALFQYTPRGGNHGLDLYELARNNEEWFCQKLTVNDTKREDGTPVITEKAIEQERESGMDEDLIQQEYYCSFTAAVKGAYFSRQLTKAENEDRITKFPIDGQTLVHTYWDIGIDDSTAIWLIQRYSREFVAIAYYENHNENLQHYVNWLHQFREKFGIVYGNHYAPHDASKRDFSTGKSVIDHGQDLGIRFYRVPRIKRKQDAIEMARLAMNKTVFHVELCKQGLNCLREYHSNYNERTKTFSETPVHNWASHGSDAFMTFAQATHGKTEQQYGGIISNAVGSDSYR